GPLYSADGKTLWVPQTSDILRFTVLADGLVNPNPTVISLPSTKASSALPSGMALSPDGSRLYVAFNGLNTLGVLDTSSNAVLTQIPVGNAPRQVVLIGTDAYVSNEGGRPATRGDVTNLTDNTPVVADPSTGAANTGTVSVVDVKTGRTLSSIPVGLQPTAEYLGPDRTTLFVANSNDDSISLIDTTADRVVQTVNVNPLPGSAVGSYPTGITMSDPSTVLVSIGRDNAVAEYHYSGPQSPLQYTGLIPTDWYPAAVQYDKTLGKVVVTNDKGIGTRAPYAAAGNGTTTNDATAHQTYLDTGTVTVFSPRTADQLKADTHQVFVDNTWDQLLARSQPSADNGSAGTVPVPTRPGQQSPIKHVFLIVKENRTYDQVLGDLSKGNGDPALTEFGQNVTPNQHALVNAFGIFDNFYDEGTLSADGHNWLVQADANDYIEKEFGAFYRSYPAQGGDALAYQRNGFLWNAAARAGVSSRSYGEYNNFICFPDGRTNCPANGNVPTWSQWYHDSQVMEGKATGPLEVPHGSYTYADIGSLNAIDQHAYPMFDLDIPDQYRVDIWNRDFQRDVQDNSLANLTLIWLPDDHTSTTPEDPSPPAEVADNDQALGRIVDTISHSSVWPQSAIFVAEDDSQAGVDHVDGHRAPFLLISPYAARGVVNSTYYTQLNVVRTIEAILGMAPMNQEDRAAVPMTDAFTDQPDLTPYTALPSEIPLNLGVDPTQAGFSPTASSASALALVPASERSAAEAWFAWGAQQHFGGTTPREDFAHPEQLNRFDWYAATGWTRPYPGDSRILTPDEVPGTTLPSDYLGDG
ncbi:MAG TPA: bifunctional YncE family protein/alkaline phosphatase family protein, partial [Acidimicrobiales bacterium]|nr:bifunctional YncE family protein/alkaline phosphatase family protein [Acidimicrobiales bacterium]